MIMMMMMMMILILKLTLILVMIMIIKLTVKKKLLVEFEIGRPWGYPYHCLMRRRIFHICKNKFPACKFKILQIVKRARPSVRLVSFYIFHVQGVSVEKPGPHIAWVTSLKKLGTMSKSRNLRGIALVRGAIWGTHSLTLIISCSE